jgi:carbamoyltransferase
MFTLGINAAFHDSAACLVHDGQVVAAVEEERFTRIKHGKRPVPFSAWELPFHSIDFCLSQGGLHLRDVDCVGYSFNPNLQLGSRARDATIPIPLNPENYPADLAPWDPLFLSHILNAPRQLLDGAPLHLERRFRGVRATDFRWEFVDHHQAHAASAFLASPYQQAAVLCLDGRGELVSTTYWVGNNTTLTPLGDVSLPHSLGMLYEDLTHHLGFLRSCDEYKVMALASFGAPRYADEFRSLVRVGDGGRYTIGTCDLEQMFGAARSRGGPLEQRHYDIARSLQLVLEETVVSLASWLREASESKELCMAGGVALNCVMNARLRDTGIFDDIWVQPAAGDAGTALGAALLIDARERCGTGHYHMDHAYLGPSFDDDAIGRFLQWSKVQYRQVRDIPEAAAELLADNKVIGWFQGSMEFGPRALGARSILASPIDGEMQATLNDIKDREDFRPVAPVVTEEDASEWFFGAECAPFMLFTFDVRREKADRIPAVRHVDGTARVQTVRRDQNELYYDLLQAFKRRTGVPVLVNTSFNTRGEPLVCTPRDALECFWTSPLDALVIGSFIVEKQPASSEAP